MIDTGNLIGTAPLPSGATSASARRLPTLQRRHLVLAPILAAHAALLGWIAADRLNATPARPEAALAVFDVLPTPTPAPSSPTPMVPLPVSEIVPPPLVTPPIVPLPVSLPPAAATALPAPVAGSCDLTDTVQAALRADPTARSALGEMPPQAHSVANAVMLWDGRWIDGGKALDRIRTIVLATLRAASADCREATQAGPRLIVIAGHPDFVLALGSGRWRWGDLDTPRDAHTDPTPAARLAMQ